MFPQISDQLRQDRLTLPEGVIRMVLDTDTYNEIDDQFALPPSAAVLHYGLGCFEGMKAYKDAREAVRLFRPDRNMARLLTSAQRLALPVRTIAATYE